MLDISTKDFNRLVTFMKSVYGIDLSKKRQLIVGRLSTTVTKMGLSNFEEYVDHILKHKNPNDIEVLLNKLTTNYTFFMRESEHFEYFKNVVLPWLEKTRANKKVLSIWSAGCSSGEEPYTLSMILKDYFRNKPGWDTRVLASDISQDVLRTAQEAKYDELALKDVPADWKKRYFQKTAVPGKYTVTPEIKSNVIFRTFNLMDPIKFKLKFDVIFCRNVMIYFDQPTKDALVQRFYNASAPGAYLMIGHSEGLNKATTPYDYIMPATYRKKL